MLCLRSVIAVFFLVLSATPAFANVEFIWTTTELNDNPVTVYDGPETQNAGLPIIVTRSAPGRYSVWLNRQIDGPVGLSVTPIATRGAEPRHCSIERRAEAESGGVTHTGFDVACALPRQAYVDTAFAILIAHGQEPSAARFLRYGTSFYDTNIRSGSGQLQRRDTFPALAPLTGGEVSFSTREFPTGPETGEGKATSLNATANGGVNCRANGYGEFDDFSHYCAFVDGPPVGLPGHYIVFKEGLENVSAVAAQSLNAPVGNISLNDTGTFGDITFRVRRINQTSFRFTSDRPLDHVQLEANGGPQLCSITTRTPR